MGETHAAIYLSQTLKSISIGNKKVKENLQSAVAVATAGHNMAASL